MLIERWLPSQSKGLASDGVFFAHVGGKPSSTTAAFLILEMRLELDGPLHQPNRALYMIKRQLTEMMWTVACESFCSKYRLLGFQVPQKSSLSLLQQTHMSLLSKSHFYGSFGISTTGFPFPYLTSKVSSVQSISVVLPMELQVYSIQQKPFYLCGASMCKSSVNTTL